jgi:polar amino acid transport system substrate-binding protein
MNTIKAATLIVASAYPDPPFDVIIDGKCTGFDIELMQAICDELGLTMQTVRYTGGDFNGIFDGLTSSEYDAVISGTTITPQRAQIARFSDAYLEFGQGVAIDRERTPNVRTASDLRGLTAGIQEGNTSDAVARAFLSDGAIAGVQYYPYNAIERALDDLESGRIGLVIKLLPVISALVRDRPRLSVAFEVPTREQLGIAVAKDNVELCTALNDALKALRDRGELQRLEARWLGGSGARGAAPGG